MQSPIQYVPSAATCDCLSSRGDTDGKASAEETAQLSRAQSCWRKHRAINWLLIAASSMTMALSFYADMTGTNTIISFVGKVTGGCGFVSSDPLGLWQQLQPIQHHHFQKLQADVLASCPVFFLEFFALTDIKAGPSLFLPSHFLSNADETEPWIRCRCIVLFASPGSCGISSFALLQKGCRL